jgi:uncharacterized protein (TIGR00730 family)
MRRITLYCASSTRLPDDWYQAAGVVGASIAKAGLELVYGGGSIGLMGAAAKAAKAAGGRVHGIITSKLLAMEQGWDGCDQLDVVETMQERRRTLLELADGLLVLPGGLGTMEEFFEAIVARQLGDHGKPMVLVNIGGALSSLIDMLDDMMDRGLVRQSVRQLYSVVDDAAVAVDRLMAEPGGVVDPKAFVPSGTN